MLIQMHFNGIIFGLTENSFSESNGQKLMINVNLVPENQLKLVLISMAQTQN